jgi:hypothetical protein
MNSQIDQIIRWTVAHNPRALTIFAHASAQTRNVPTISRDVCALSECANLKPQQACEPIAFYEARVLMYNVPFQVVRGVLARAIKLRKDDYAAHIVSKISPLHYGMRVCDVIRACAFNCTKTAIACIPRIFPSENLFAAALYSRNDKIIDAAWAREIEVHSFAHAHSIAEYKAIIEQEKIQIPV